MCVCVCVRVCLRFHRSEESRSYSGSTASLPLAPHRLGHGPSHPFAPEEPACAAKIVQQVNIAFVDLIHELMKVSLGSPKCLI